MERFIERVVSLAKTQRARVVSDNLNFMMDNCQTFYSHALVFV